MAEYWTGKKPVDLLIGSPATGNGLQFLINVCQNPVDLLIGRVLGNDSLQLAVDSWQQLEVVGS